MTPLETDPWERLKRAQLSSGTGMTPQGVKLTLAELEAIRAERPRSGSEFTYKEFKAIAGGLPDLRGDVSDLGDSRVSLSERMAKELLAPLVDLEEPEIAAAVASCLAADPELRRQIEAARDRLCALLEESKR